jgi:DNA-binding transcriptional LysR family regulator
VSQTGGIASAVKVLGISHPAVTQAIAKLEDQTSLVLFRRLHARGMELTAQGIEFQLPSTPALSPDILSS